MVVDESSSSEISSASSSSSEENEVSANDEICLYRRNKKARTDVKANAIPTHPPPLEIAPSVRSIDHQAKDAHATNDKVIVLLDQARLETVKNRRGNFELLNCDDHRDLCRKKLKRDPKEFRPDICHQELLALLDSPLNKAGCLQVYMRTSQNVLIEFHPSVRIPRTFKRFCGLIVQLLHKLKIKAADSGITLMKVIKNPFSQHLPVGTRVYGMSCQGTLYNPQALASSLVPLVPPSAGGSNGKQPPVCFIIGAMSAGHVTMEDYPYIEKMFSISEYPLSGATAINRILGSIENQWGIV